MAKGYPISGKIRGKLGANVYRVQRGEQIISEYNAHKSGSPSDTQLQQRSKMSVANEVSRLFTYPCIAGFSPSPAKARNAFVGSLARLAVVEPDPTYRYVATIDTTGVQLSKGVQVETLGKQLRSDLTTSLKVTSTITFASPSDAERFLFVVLLQDVATGAYFRTYHVVSGAKGSNGRCDAQIQIAASNTAINAKVYGYAVPLVPNTLAKRAVYGKLQEDGTLESFTAETAVTLSRADIMAGTIYIGQTTI